MILENKRVKEFSSSYIGENILLAPSTDHWRGSQSALSSSALRAHVVDLEGPSYLFQSVFLKPGAAKVL